MESKTKDLVNIALRDLARNSQRDFLYDVVDVAIKEAKQQVFDDMNIYLDEVDGSMGHLIVSHGIDLSKIKPSYKDIKKKHGVE